MSNGPTRVTVDVSEIRPGWAYLSAGKQAPKPDILPKFLDQAMKDWLRDNPDFEVRAVLPLQRNGHTFAIHVWYDE